MGRQTARDVSQERAAQEPPQGIYECSELILFPLNKQQAMPPQMLKLIRKKHHDKHTSRKACLVIDWWAEWLQQTISHRSHHGIGPSLAGADASGGKFQGAWKPRTDLRTSSSIHICLKCRWVLSNVGDDVAKCTAGWNFWSSQHLHLQQRQQLEWQELTLMENESTGLTGGARLVELDIC